jgi:hypothetical protein
MPGLEAGALQLPLRHLSVRVPWNDTDWTGRVCQRPADNNACLILRRVRDARNDRQEAALSGRSWQELPQSELPPCVSEHGHFMAPYELTRIAEHPYVRSSPAHKHLAPTPFRYPPYSSAALPFSWMLRDEALTKARDFELGFEEELEEAAHAAMGFKTEWVQTKHNQLVMLDTFFSAIQPNRSLCLFYAKRTPLVEDTRRVLVGVGFVTSLGQPVEYLYSGRGPLKSMLWERPVQHSIRPDFANGFLLPYQAVATYLEQHPEDDPAQYVAFVPDEHFWSFSYASEHVTNDGAIGALLACAKTLENIARIVPGPWDLVARWIDARLNELWRMRGPSPGLGAALTAFGIERGTLMSYEVERRLEANDQAGGDPWPLVSAMLEDPAKAPADLRQFLTNSLRLKWQRLSAERRRLLTLLSRFELTPQQAACYYVHEDQRRADLRLQVSDAEILSNPYLLYELDRAAPDSVALSVVDRGLFPDPVIRTRYPLPEPSTVPDPTDARRVRAFTVYQLEQAAAEGDTLRPRGDVIRVIREMDVQPGCPVDGDLMAVVDDGFTPVVQHVELSDGARAYQLNRLAAAGLKIRQEVKVRSRGKRHEAAIDWRTLLDAALPALDRGDEAEERGRVEKAAALCELYAGRFAVLIGPAGTGKTTLLKVLCTQPQVAQGGVLLLAPTGKARVRLEQATGLKGAKTIAQLLVPLDRYDPLTGAYRMSDRIAPIDAGRTVVIDEASMLTEEQLSAVLQALRGVERLILVGDPRQLPPIGAGRPFLDIVRHLAPSNAEAMFPRVAPGYAELTVRRRQQGRDRPDLQLAEWFGGRTLEPAADEVWQDLASETSGETLRFVRWENSDELQAKLMQVLGEELAPGGLGEREFEMSLGGTPFEGSRRIFFRYGNPGASQKAEAWQILSPVRNTLHGVEALNRLIQTTFRKGWLEEANRRPGPGQAPRRIPKPLGKEGIIYGDKVINVTNQHRHDVWPKANALQYVANGEIGIVVGEYKGASSTKDGPPWKLQVEFSSQGGYAYGYSPNKDFGEEGNPPLELAYALTVHKCQGSEFGLTLVVIPDPCRLLSRELLYTALTRQQRRVVIFHQGDPVNLLRYAGDYYSESARRLTNLFGAPCPVAVQDRFLEEGLIHRTRRGDSVRSKSEVIIADLLYSKGIDYTYEQAYHGTDGKTRYPDFTIEDPASGLTVIWEHLGLLSDPGYRARWQRKLEWYRRQGVTPSAEGGGSRGLLVTTEDDARGGIDSAAIEAIIKDTLGF